jgi:hypothetical protein
LTIEIHFMEKVEQRKNLMNWEHRSSPISADLEQSFH